MFPFLSGADGEGRRLFQVGSVSDLPGRAALSVVLQRYAARPPLLGGGDVPLFVFGLPDLTFGPCYIPSAGFNELYKLNDA